MATLRPHHREQLDASGLKDPAITERGYFSAQFKTDLAPHGFSKWQCSQTPALAIPIYDVHGDLRLHQMRPDITPEINGTTMKYMTPKGHILCLDVPRLCLSILADASIPILITEGSKKVDAVMQKGIHCIGVLGVTGWMRDGKPLPDLDYINFQGRKVYLCFDNDVSTKFSVRRALEMLKAELERRGAQVWIIYLPEPLTPEGDLIKVGVDDYLLDHTAEELLARAEPELRPAPKLADCEPTDALRRVRKETFTRQLRGKADVNPHGGLAFSKEITSDGIEYAARVVCKFYSKIDDAKKWDCIDIREAASPFITYGKGKEWNEQHFGRFAKQVDNWRSAVGEAFAKNLDGRRRSHLPIWLHEYVKELTPAQQDSVFDTFEAAEGGYMTRNAVVAMIEAQFPTEPKVDDKESRKGGVPRPELDWEAIAQQIESVSDIGKEVAPHILSAISKCGARFVAKYLAACPDEPEDNDDSAWDGRDVYDNVPETEMSQESAPCGLDSHPVFEPKNDDSATTIFEKFDENEIEMGSEVFTVVKTGESERAENPTADTLQNEHWHRDENGDYRYNNLPPIRQALVQSLSDGSYRLTLSENGEQVGNALGTPTDALLETALEDAEEHIRNTWEVFCPYKGEDRKLFLHNRAENFNSTVARYEDTASSASKQQDAYADLLAEAHAGRLPFGIRIELSSYKTSSDMNKTVLAAFSRQDTQTLGECQAAWKRERPLCRT